MSKRTELREKALALSNKDIQMELDSLSNLLISNETNKALEVIDRISEKIKELKVVAKELNNETEKEFS